MPRARARHIQTAARPIADQLKDELLTGADFAELAAKHSTCVTACQGGQLGEFSPGQMPPEMDAVIFKEPLQQIHGPIQTPRGFHLIQITWRLD